MLTIRFMKLFMFEIIEYQSSAGVLLKYVFVVVAQTFKFLEIYSIILECVLSLLVDLFLGNRNYPAFFQGILKFYQDAGNARTDCVWWCAV